MTVFVALTHAGYILDWYFAFSPWSQYEGLLFANTSYGQVLGFPFEAFGIFALALSPGAVDHEPRLLAEVPDAAPLEGAALPHLPGLRRGRGPCEPRRAAGLPEPDLRLDRRPFGRLGHRPAPGRRPAREPRRRRSGRGPAAAPGRPSARPTTSATGFARVAILSTGERVAVFRHQDRLSAISNACAHQNGPLGEGRIIDCLVTCPWHGFQYNVTDGRSPAPFTETVPTYRLRAPGRHGAGRPQAPTRPAPSSSRCRCRAREPTARHEQNESKSPSSLATSRSRPSCAAFWSR